MRKKLVEIKKISEHGNKISKCTEKSENKTTKLKNLKGKSVSI